jgi:hypothetical protein
MTARDLLALAGAVHFTLETNVHVTLLLVEGTDSRETASRCDAKIGAPKAYVQKMMQVKKLGQKP